MRALWQYRYTAVTIGHYGTNRKTWYVKRVFCSIGQKPSIVQTSVVFIPYDTRKVADREGRKIARREGVFFIPDIYRGNVLELLSDRDNEKERKDGLQRKSCGCRKKQYGAIPND